MLKQQTNNKNLVWKRINMRNVDHLLGAEFIHNLYNRHVSRINSIRFRHTKVTWKDGQVNSYAPVDEWKYLQTCFGEKFIHQDKFLLSQMETLLNFDRDFLNNFIEYLEKFDYKNTSNQDLALLLIDVQNYILGELYSVNLVQIEQGLTYALDKLLYSYEKSESKRYEIISKIIVTDHFTEAQIEELDFAKIVRKGKKSNVDKPKNNLIIKNKIKNHHKKYAHMHCAYGELPRSVDSYYEKYISLYNDELLTELKLKLEIDKLIVIKNKLLNKLSDNKITKLADIMSRVGVFRDYNKARLGQTVKYRLKILDEIARRHLDSRENVNFYLLSEIVNLLRTKNKLDKKIIIDRKNKGITITRNEHLELGLLDEETHKKERKLKGVCASPGILEGICKIVLSKKDTSKIKRGDIMIAIGTDFDLMDAIQRSAAVITEEGGLLSHASVVCRELKKPCCIGVENVTLILHDGDLIELDAAKGLIKIIL